MSYYAYSKEVSDHLKNQSRSASWMSPSFLNEIIQFFADEVRRLIKKEIHDAKYFTVLADETKDISKREQLSIAFRYVHDFKTIERFTGYTLASELTARAFAGFIFQRMTDLELDSNNLVS